MRLHRRELLFIFATLDELRDNADVDRPCAYRQRVKAPTSGRR
jgi:hypothetical protein